MIILFPTLFHRSSCVPNFPIATQLDLVGLPILRTGKTDSIRRARFERFGIGAAIRLLGTELPWPIILISLTLCASFIRWYALVICTNAILWESNTYENRNRVVGGDPAAPVYTLSTSPLSRKCWPWFKNESISPHQWRWPQKSASSHACYRWHIDAVSPPHLPSWSDRKESLPWSVTSRYLVVLLSCNMSPSCLVMTTTSVLFALSDRQVFTNHASTTRRILWVLLE